MAQTTDIKEIRRQKLRERFLIKVMIALFLVLTVVFIYANRDKWFPKLEGIGGKYEDALESDGSFPISVSGSVEYQLDVSGDNLVVLSNTGLKVYSKNGSLTANFQHAYSTPVLHTSSKRILVYDNGGVKFRVDAKNKAVYEKTLDDNILLARVSDEGYAAVVTTSDMYVCLLYVFDENGKNVYTRGCTEKITDITFAEQSTACYAVSTDVLNGHLISQIQYFKFFEDENSTLPGDKTIGGNSATLALDSVFFDDGGYLTIGDSMAAYYNSAGNVDKLYSYSDELISYCTDSDGRAALLFENTDMRCTNLVLLQRGAQNTPVLTLPQSCNCITINGDEVYTCVDGALVSYKFDGTASKNIGVSLKASDIAIIEDYAYLLGYDKIERFDLVLSSNQ